MFETVFLNLWRDDDGNPQAEAFQSRPRADAAVFPPLGVKANRTACIKLNFEHGAGIAPFPITPYVTARIIGDVPVPASLPTRLSLATSDPRLPPALASLMIEAAKAIATLSADRENRDDHATEHTPTDEQGEAQRSGSILDGPRTPPPRPAMPRPVQDRAVDALLGQMERYQAARPEVGLLMAPHELMLLAYGLRQGGYGLRAEPLAPSGVRPDGIVPAGQRAAVNPEFDRMMREQRARVVDPPHPLSPDPRSPPPKPSP